MNSRSQHSALFGAIDLVALAILISFVTVAHAEGFTDKEKEIVADQDRKFDLMYAGNTNRYCETKIKASIDWGSFASEVRKIAKKKKVPSIFNKCGDALDHLKTLCQADGYKDNVQAQVTSYRCRYDDKTNPSVVLKGKKMIFTINWTAEGLHRLARKATEEQLRDGEYNLRQAKLIRSENGYFRKLTVTPTNKKCETKISAEIDWPSFAAEVDKRLDKNREVSIQSACSLPLQRLGAICDWDKKKPVQKKVTSYKCVFGGKKKRSIKLKKGALEYRVDFSARKNVGLVDKFLIKKRIAKKRPPVPKDADKTLRDTLREDEKNRTPAQKCQRGCSKKCSSVRARAKNACRKRCRKKCRR